MTQTNNNLANERAVMVCPQCEGEGSYADGVNEMRYQLRQPPTW